MALEAQIRKENEEYFAIYDYIKTSVSPGDRFAILKANGQAFSVPSEPQVNVNVRYRLVYVFSHCKTINLFLFFQSDHSSIGRNNLLWCSTQMPKMPNRPAAVL